MSMNLPKLTFFMFSTLLLFSCDGSNTDKNKVISQKPCEGINTTANILTEIDENIYNSDELWKLKCLGFHKLSNFYHKF